jgi:hypothetical protein
MVLRRLRCWDIVRLVGEVVVIVLVGAVVDPEGLRREKDSDMVVECKGRFGEGFG